MHDFIELARVLAGPITVIIGLLVLTAEFKGFARTMAERVQSAHSIRIGPSGLEITGFSRAIPLPTDVQTRKVELSRFFRALRDKALLGKIADALGVARNTEARPRRSDIILQINRRG